MKRLTERFRHFGQDKVVAIILLGCTVVSALTQPISPFPRDGWFESQYRLFGRFPGEDNYTPIAAPAVFYRIVHWLALPTGMDLRGEMYLASVAQNCLLFLSGCLVYYTCKQVSSRKVACIVAVSFLMFVLSVGLAQAFWSENVVLVMFSAVLYLNTKIYYETADTSRAFWRRATLSSLFTGLLVITRMTPVLLIPGILFLLYGRLSQKRLASYAALACLTTALMLGAMLASNSARFGRPELTNSSGRHLWQGVTPIVETTLAGVPEFLELKALNPKIQWMNWYEMRLPNDGRQKFDGEQFLGRLARQSIRSHPFLYLRLGLTKFFTTIGQPPRRLGSDVRGSHHLLATDPLRTDSLLPPLGETVFKLPAFSMIAARHAIAAMFSLGRIIYPIAVFFVLTTYSVLAVRGARLSPIPHKRWGRGAGAIKYPQSWHVLAGILLLGMIYVTNISQDRLLIWVVRGLCALVLLLQVMIIGGCGMASAGQQPSRDTPDGITYSFLAFMFFGSLWLSWQVETNNTRNVLPYLPFLSVMLAMALRYWLGAAQPLRSISSINRWSC
ncbi:MAG: hypothetical protein ACLPX1_04870 [Steroidobacteraceae bacterium]